MKTHRKILIIGGIVLGVAILIPVIRHYQLRAATEAYIAELRTKGEPIDLAQVIPTPVSPDKNSAPIILKAVALLNTNSDVLSTNSPLAMHEVAPGKAMVGWQQSEIRDSSGTNSWKEIGGALAQEEAALNLMMLLTNSARFDFDVQYAQDFDMPLTHLASEKKITQRLVTRAIYHLHLGDANTAAKNIEALFILVNGTDDERLAISQLVRIAIAQNGIAAVWELLQSTNVTDENLARLQMEVSHVEFIPAELNFLLVERRGDLATLAKWHRSNVESDKYFLLMKRAHESLGYDTDDETFWDKAKFTYNRFMWSYWWSYPDELRGLKGYEALMNTVRSIETNGSFYKPLTEQTKALDELGISKLNDSLDTLFSGQFDFRSMSSESIVTLGSVTRKIMRVEASKQLAMTAIALKRYQLKHGNYPANLNLLVPELVASVPLDPVDGQPLRYRLKADGTFLLYSIGANGKDDGGDPTSSEKDDSAKFTHYIWQNIKNLDWVWPQPASASEVEAFYMQPPK